jgi:tRNA (guanine-N7-)-methyltransferase
MENVLPRLRIAPPEDVGPVDMAGALPADFDQLWMEIGFGAGEHLAAQAEEHPRIGFIGCEPFINGVANLIFLVNDRGLDNVRVFDDDARVLLPALPDACLDRVFLLFADPWPKWRHRERRFVGPKNLDALARVMKDNTELRFASDDMNYVRWALEQVTRHPDFLWPARSRRDWQRPDNWFETRYESKALERGAWCAYLRFIRRPRGQAER